MDHFAISANAIFKGLCQGVRQDIFFPGFPTLKHLPHKVLRFV